MAEPFKNRINADCVAFLAERLAAVGPLDIGGFTRDSLNGLETLELKDRVRHLAGALWTHLDDDVPTAISQIVASLPPPLETDNDVTEAFWIWPLTHYVEAYAVDHPDAAIPALRELTTRFSAEFAIRPFLIRYPERMLDQLHVWVEDPNVHVRRLVSEGTRPLLPWGQRLPAFREDPSPVLPLLVRLRDDPELYVRRSVANHLNDIAKDHPDRVVELAVEWLKDASKEREWLVKHALRSLLKRSHPGALAALGFGPPEVELVSLEVVPGAVVVGDSVTVTMTLRSTSAKPQRLVIDYAVHHVRANGKRSPKVFKWTTRELGPGETMTLTKVHSMRQVTTRRYYAGEHAVELIANGQPQALVPFRLAVGEDVYTRREQ